MSKQAMLVIWQKVFKAEELASKKGPDMREKERQRVQVADMQWTEEKEMDGHCKDFGIYS